MSKTHQKIVVACPDRFTDNDPEYFGLAFHHQCQAIMNPYNFLVTNVLQMYWNKILRDGIH